MGIAEGISIITDAAVSLLRALCRKEHTTHGWSRVSEEAAAESIRDETIWSLYAS